MKKQTQNKPNQAALSTACPERHVVSLSNQVERVEWTQFSQRPKMSATICPTWTYQNQPRSGSKSNSNPILQQESRPSVKARYMNRQDMHVMPVVTRCLYVNIGKIQTSLLNDCAKRKADDPRWSSASAFSLPRSLITRMLPANYSLQ
jgi:hypothetical protein